MDSRLRGNDKKKQKKEWIPACAGMTRKNKKKTGFPPARE